MVYNGGVTAESRNPVKTQLDDATYDTLDEIVLQIRREVRHRNLRKKGREFGVGNLIPAILERVLAKHPELLNEAANLAFTKYTGTDLTSLGGEQIEAVDRRVFKRDIPLKGGPHRR